MYALRGVCVCVVRACVGLLVRRHFHVAGGQIVQRHALFTNSPSGAARSAWLQEEHTLATTVVTRSMDNNGNTNKTSPAAPSLSSEEEEEGATTTLAKPAGSGLVRHVVANPSSFAYLDGRRWVNGTVR